MCSLSVKVTLNVRIVVVGASEVGMSLLETFVFWYVTQGRNFTPKSGGDRGREHMANVWSASV